MSANPASDSPTIARECDTRDKARRMRRDYNRLGRPKVETEKSGWPTNDEYIDRASRREDMTTECAYCGHDVPGNGEEPTPAVDDDDTWANLANHHADDCEWIATRAHRIDA